jgi:DNA-binding winged helix-turn-helix (wHTH) protein
LKPVVLRFGVYEIDGRTGQLRREGAHVRLARQPFKVLWLLASRAGDVVTRDEIRALLWGGDTFVDFDGSLNFCIAQVRKALRDNADAPVFVATLPRRGYQFVAPVECVLSAEEETPAEPSAVPETTEDTVEALATPLRSRRLWAAPPTAVVAVCTLLAAAGATALVARLAPTRATPSYTRLTFRAGRVLGARFGPDGQIVYSATTEGPRPTLFQTRAGAREARSVRLGTANVKGVLPSGEIAAIQTAEDGRTLLVRVPTDAGAPRVVREDVTDADWPSDAQGAVAVQHGVLTHLEFPMGHDVYHVLGTLSDLRISRDGTRVAFFEHRTVGDDRGDVVLVDHEGHRTVLASDWSSLEGLAWSPDGSEVWFTGTRVGADLTLQAVAPGAEPREILAGPGRLVLHDAATDGRLLLGRTTRQLRIVASSGGVDRELSWLDTSLAAAVTRDGSTVVIGESGQGAGGGYSVFTRRMDGTQAVRLGEGRAMAPSPDGTLVLSVAAAGAPRILVLPTEAGEARTLATGFESIAFAAWFPAGDRIVFVAAEPGHRFRVYAQELRGGPARAVTPEGIAYARPLVAPDALSVVARGEGRDGAWLRHPLGGGAPTPVPGVEPSDQPIVWTEDGTALFVARNLPGTTITRIDRVQGSGARETFRVLHPENGRVMGVPQVTPDGRTVVYTVEALSSELFEVAGLR